MTKKQQAEADALASGNDKETLIALAEKAEVETTGTKADIAERIILAQSKAGTTADETEDAPPAPAPVSSGDALSPDNRIARLETGLQTITESFMAHTHNDRGVVQVQSADEQNASASSPSVDQTKEAEARQKAGARRDELLKRGHNPEDPVPDEDENEEEDAASEK